MQPLSLHEKRKPLKQSLIQKQHNSDSNNMLFSTLHSYQALEEAIDKRKIGYSNKLVKDNKSKNQQKYNTLNHTKPKTQQSTRAQSKRESQVVTAQAQYRSTSASSRKITPKKANKLYMEMMLKERCKQTKMKKMEDEIVLKQMESYLSNRLKRPNKENISASKSFLNRQL